MTHDVLSEAEGLIRSGKKAEAQQQLEPFLEANPHNLRAWLLEAQTWPAGPSQVKVLWTRLLIWLPAAASPCRCTTR